MIGLRYIIRGGPVIETGEAGVAIELQVADDPYVFRACISPEDAIRFAQNIIQAAHQAIARCPPSSKRKQ